MIICSPQLVVDRFGTISDALATWAQDILDGGTSLGAYPSPHPRVWAKVMRYPCEGVCPDELEAHRLNVDIQILLSGTEGLVVSHAAEGIEPVRASIEDDNYFYKTPNAAHHMLLLPSAAAVFFPSDLHAGGLATPTPGIVSKVVFKVDVETARWMFGLTQDGGTQLSGA